MSLSLYNNPSEKKLLSVLENQNFERKTAYIQPKDLASEFSAFANSSVEGGLVALGIEKDKTVVGINIVGQEKINKLIQAQRVFSPLAKVKHKVIPVKNSKSQKDRLLLFFVEFSSDKVIKLNSGEAFKRVGDQTCEMSFEETRQMEFDKGETEFEKELVSNLTMDKLNKKLVDDFIKKWIKHDGLNHRPTIENLILMKGFGKKVHKKIKINYAGALLFHKNPDEFIPGAKIRFLRYEGIEVETGSRSNIIKDKYFEGPIMKQIDGLAEMVRSQAREFSFLGKDGKFKTVLEYPEFAWYEAVVNAVVHRAYNLKNASIFVRMFDDHIEVQSPGNLPGIVTVKNIYKENFPRNPILMQALLYLGYVKSASEGVDRIREEMIKLNLPTPEFENDIDSVLFRLSLRNNIEKRIIKSGLENIEEIDQRILKSLDKDEKKIIYFLLKNEIGAPIDFEKEIEKKRATVVRKLRHLESLCVVQRTEMVGPNVKYVLNRQVLLQSISSNQGPKRAHQVKLL